MKKLFSIVTIVALLGTVVSPLASKAASYSDELQGAYDYAYGKGITTQSSIDGANIYGNLTRGAMAKMMVNYAKEVLGKTADTSKACSFSDVGSSLGDLEGFITEACQMGIMGVGISAFNPNGIVTRADFGTAFSRVLFGDKNNGGSPYYANHLSALKDAGVMSNISNPSAKEVRGYVMLMMKRADDNNVASEKPAVCSTVENALSCSLGLDTCPAECKEVAKEEVTETKAGALNISLNSNSAANATQVPSTGIVRFAVVDFAARSSDVSLKTVELSKIGLASIPSSTRVWFEKDGIRISGKAAFSSEGKAVISFAPIFVVKAGNTESLDLYVDLSTFAGQDFQFASSTIGSTAESVNGSFTTPTLRTAAYSVVPVRVSKTSTTATYNASKNGVELGAFSVEMDKTNISETRDLKFQSITLRQNGNGNLSNLADIVLERNGEIVAKNPTVNGKDLTFSVKNTIKDSTTATYYVKAIVNDVDNNGGDTYQFTVRTTSDVNVIEVSTAFRSTVALGTTWTGTTVDLNSYTVQGGDITFARDSSVALSKNYAQGTEDVVLMKGTIKVNSAMTLEDPSLGFTTQNVAGDLSKMFSTIYLTIGSSTFSYSPVSGQTTAQFLGSVTVNSSATVKMYGKLKDTSGTGYIKFNDLNLSAFARAEYVSNSNTVSTAIGSISAVAVTSQAATLNVTRSDALGNSTIAAGSKNVLVYGLKLTSDQGNGVKVSRVVLDVTAAGSYANNVTLNLYANGSIIASKTVTTGTVTFDGLNQTVAVNGSGVDYAVKADFTDAMSTGSFQVTLNSLNATDLLTSNNVSYSKPAGAAFTIGSASATLAASSSNPTTQLLLSPDVDQKIVAFKITASNDTVMLNDIAIAGTNLDKLSNFRLTDGSGTVFATATSTSGTAVSFTNTTNANAIAKDQSSTYYVIADVNSNTTGTVAMTVAMTGTKVKSSNGTTINVGGAAVVSNTHALAENLIKVQKQVLGSDKSLISSALKFTVRASGKNSVTLTGLTLNNQLAGYTTTASQIVIYKDSVNAANIAGTGAVGTITGPITLNANNVVDAGQTVTYIVAIENTVAAAASNTLDWSVSLTNILFGGLSASTYTNIASFPLTEVK